MKAPVYLTHDDFKHKGTIKSHLATIFGLIFLEFLVMGISLGTLPTYIHNKLGFNSLVVGLVIGMQYIATLTSRHLAGRTADTKGGKKSAVLGLILSAASGACCLLSPLFVTTPLMSLFALIIGRTLLGVGESFLVIGIFYWGFSLMGPKHTAKVMVWNGMGMYGGMACGAPLGVFLQTHWSLSVAFLGILVCPLLSFVGIQLLPEVTPPPTVRHLSFRKALAMIWRPGTGLALASIGFGCIGSFITLYFLQQSWAGATFAITAFGAGYVFMRICFSGFPDKFGGARVAIVSLMIEVTGQLVIWKAPSATIAVAGAALTGIGMSLVFPSFGLMAVRKASVENRGMAIAAYNAFFDIGVGITAPVAGLVAGQRHYREIYLLGAIAAVVSIFCAFREYREEKRTR